MAKLSEIQKQLQDNVQNVIDKTEEQYLVLTDKSLEATQKLLDQQKQLVIRIFDQMRTANARANEYVLKLIKTVEGEPTLEDKAKAAVDKAAEASKNVIEKAGEVAQKASGKAKAIKEEVTA